ncbi:hypothetical protein SDC9_87563 [bioreactor metagenome]|uniref:Uncharacterized protein n=1 Tax=bioreactor metagenome TaxID=1076179 RepID=A0A644ZTL5_9ZZZZ
MIALVGHMDDAEARAAEVKRGQGAPGRNRIAAFGELLGTGGNRQIGQTAGFLLGSRHESGEHIAFMDFGRINIGGVEPPCRPAAQQQNPQPAPFPFQPAVGPGRQGETAAQRQRRGRQQIGTPRELQYGQCPHRALPGQKTGRAQQTEQPGQQQIVAPAIRAFALTAETQPLRHGDHQDQADPGRYPEGHFHIRQLQEEPGEGYRVVGDGRTAASDGMYDETGLHQLFGQWRKVIQTQRQRHHSRAGGGRNPPRFAQQAHHVQSEPENHGDGNDHQREIMAQDDSGQPEPEVIKPPALAVKNFVAAENHPREEGKGQIFAQRGADQHHHREIAAPAVEQTAGEPGEGCFADAQPGVIGAECNPDAPEHQK